MKRNPHLDFLKGIAIIAVVIGHCWLLDRPMRNFLYSFHLPLFFCISGYLLNNKAPFKKFIVSKAGSILKPYAFYFICSYLCTVLIFKYPVTLELTLKGLFLGGNYCTEFYNAPLWYLPLFFISVCVFYWILKIKPLILQYAIIITGAVLSLPFNQLLYTYFPDKLIPFNIQALLPSLFFMFIGHEFRRIDLNRLKSKINGYGLFACAMLLFGIGTIIGKDNIDQINSLFMTYEFYFYPLLIIPLIVLIGCGTRNKHIEYLGANSITILGLHRLVFYIFSDTLGLKKYFVADQANSFLSVIFISAVCLFVIYIGKSVYNYLKLKLNSVIKSYI